jgi:FKBP-type peptidyl-prolyl cis-trans isomerase FkpA/FKBP-type peptidyl-prolyl cis-trans isomerase FklB
MKLFYSATLAVSLLALSACNKGGGNFKSDLKTDEQKFSYIIGQQIGGSLKGQGFTVDMPALASSIDDVLQGKPSRVPMEEAQSIMTKMQTKMMEKAKEEGKANKAKADKFLAENKAKAEVKTTASGLQYQVITEGKGATPKDSDVVMVHYKGTLLDGTEFDSSYSRNSPAQFPVKGVIRGWTEMLQLMKVGGKVKAFIPPDLAYGEDGRPGIPPNSLLVFEMELLEVKAPGAAPNSPHVKTPPPAKKK